MGKGFKQALNRLLCSETLKMRNFSMSSRAASSWASGRATFSRTQVWKRSSATLTGLSVQTTPEEWRQATSRSLMSLSVPASSSVCKLCREVLRWPPTIRCNLMNSDMRALAKALSVSLMKAISCTLCSLRALISVMVLSTSSAISSEVSGGLLQASGPGATEVASIGMASDASPTSRLVVLVEASSSSRNLP